MYSTQYLASWSSTDLSIIIILVTNVPFRHHHCCCSKEEEAVELAAVNVIKLFLRPTTNMLKFPDAFNSSTSACTSSIMGSQCTTALHHYSLVSNILSLCICHDRFLRIIQDDTWKQRNTIVVQ